MIERAEYLADIERAVRNSGPYAAAKFSISDQQWCYYPIARQRSASAVQQAALHAHLNFHMTKQAGIYPCTESFTERFIEFYISHLRNVDCIGLHSTLAESELISHWGINAKCIHFVQQEPDRSIPNNEANCFLRHFRDMRIVIVSPIARFLQSRATQATFEAVWSKTGKPWFFPKSVAAIEFPFGVYPETQTRYPTALDIFDNVADELSRCEFDIALVGAGGLGIPIASTVKQLGKIAVSLGGHLQPLFGVSGKRWREKTEWTESYFNHMWASPPPEYHPTVSGICDEGAYW